MKVESALVHVDESSGIVKRKIRQLYAFLKEANQLQFRPIRVLAEQPKFLRLDELPDHPSVQIFRPVQVENTQDTPDILLRVTRPFMTRCPTPPASLHGWLLPNWDDPSRKASLAESQNALQIDEEGHEQTVTHLFEDDEQRVADYRNWAARRNEWTPPELAARKAMQFFEVFYDIYSNIEKDGEQFELLVADGHLSWQTTSGNDGPIKIDHPILLKRVELRFDAYIPEFTLHETDREPELYGGLFVDLKAVEPAALQLRKGELEKSAYHPLGWDDTDAFLRAFIQTVSPLDGEFLEQPGDGTAENPRMWRAPVLLLRKRFAGMGNAVDGIIENIDQRDAFTSSLAQITGTINEWTGSGLDDGTGPNIPSEPTHPELTDDDILLAKEANAEQIQIIRRLDRSGAVIVQGPPGTGKTHTIGNLIGHLLAQGKSILVTAHTAKALRVLRDKVPVVLQPLCVSVLGSDQGARQQLESSIGAITERLTSDTGDALLQKAEKLTDERRKLLKSVNEQTHRLREALENEYREIIVGDKKFTPTDAARFVSANQSGHDWIPSSVKLGASIGLPEQDIVRLYALNCSFDATEEQDARLPLPEMAFLPSERQFEVMVSEHQNLLASDLSFGLDKWQTGSRGGESLETLVNVIQSEFSDGLRLQAWRPFAIVAGMHGNTDKQVWERLIENIETAAKANAKHALVLHHRPRLSEALSGPKQHQIAVEICAHLDVGGKLGFIQLATRSEWRQLIKTVSVAAGQPSHRDHFEAIKHLAALESARLELEDLWDLLIGQHIDRRFASMGVAPELACRALIPEIRRCLDWFAKVWMPMANKLRDEGLKLDQLMAAQPREASQIAEYLVLEKLSSSLLIQILACEGARRRLSECEAGFVRLANLSSQVDPISPDRGCIGRIIAAVRSRDTEAYSSALEYTRRLHAVKSLIDERDGLLARLKLVAPGWAEHIAHRVPPHHAGQAPGVLATAWTWRQLHDTLQERDKLDTQEIQRNIEQTRNILRNVTLRLIDAKAWGKQLQRLQGNSAIRQALVGWLDTMKLLVSTKKPDKRQTLLTEARKLMKKSAEAVPVWIMPISIVAESFDPRTTRFDVVIIDEASQADMNALIPLYMGEQIVVVGDHEQVGPLGAGKDQTILDNLRKSMLQDIPNAHLYDYMFSIYKIGRQSFGDGIMLVEHFRCVPEIITYSNQLSYLGKIRPLRESNSTDIKPACVACRVKGVRQGDTNQLEAERIVATIQAMIRHPAYAGKTIGVISMLAGAQAILIQSMLHKEIDGVEIEKRRIQAGIASEFQGDERDVIFLSMVDSPAEEGPLRATGDGPFDHTKQRYNVAASRARDQLWVVHSFDPDLHLKSTDIRYGLLQHIRDPLASIRALRQEEAKTESPFEREVLKRLSDAGFRVKAQWQVGYFRIDLVVEGGGKRLAVECDGDRYHPMEKLAEDIDRQTILERLGWQFIRIRGSAFYRNPDIAMQTVFARLAELEIPPESPNETPTESNLLLVQELDELIRQGFEPKNINIPASPAPIMSLKAINTTDSATTSASARDISVNAPNDISHKPGRVEPRSSSAPMSAVEVVLARMGGEASLEVFLREFAKARGHKKLGSNIRAGLEREVSRMQFEHAVTVEAGVIRLARV